MRVLLLCFSLLLGIVSCWIATTYISPWFVLLAVALSVFLCKKIYGTYPLRKNLLLLLPTAVLSFAISTVWCGLTMGSPMGDGLSLEEVLYLALVYIPGFSVIPVYTILQKCIVQRRGHMFAYARVGLLLLVCLVLQLASVWAADIIATAAI